MRVNPTPNGPRAACPGAGAVLASACGLPDAQPVRPGAGGARPSAGPAPAPGLPRRGRRPRTGRGRRGRPPRRGAHGGGGAAARGRRGAGADRRGHGLPRPATDGACEDVEVPTGHPGRVLGTLVAALADVLAAHRPSAVLVHGGGTAALAGRWPPTRRGCTSCTSARGCAATTGGSPRSTTAGSWTAWPTCAAPPPPRPWPPCAPRVSPTTGSCSRVTPSWSRCTACCPTTPPRTPWPPSCSCPPGTCCSRWTGPSTPGSPTCSRSSWGRWRARRGRGAGRRPGRPSTAQRWREQGFGGLLDRCTVLGPLDPVQWTVVQHRAAVLVSDADGAAEEASVLKRPALLVRRATERPEVLGTFTTLVPGGLRPPPPPTAPWPTTRPGCRPCRAPTGTGPRAGSWSSRWSSSSPRSEAPGRRPQLARARRRRVPAVAVVVWRISARNWPV